MPQKKKIGKHSIIVYYKKEKKKKQEKTILMSHTYSSIPNEIVAEKRNWKTGVFLYDVNQFLLKFGESYTGSTINYVSAT